MEDFAGKICPVCKREIRSFEKVTVCSECGIPHHQKCWEENSGCSTFGCGQQGSYKKPVTATLSKEGEMKCPKCGALLDDDSRFCVNCGTSIEQPILKSSLNDIGTTQNNSFNRNQYESNNMNNPNKSKNTLGKVVSAIVSIALIVIGVIRIVTAGTSISSTSFGGDFYTYTYKGIVAISEILSSVEVTLGWVIIAIGAAIGVKVFRD